jgi:hypothetical protein
LPGHLSVEQDLFILAGILVAIALLIVAAGVLMLRRAPRQPFFLIRQQTAAAGWRLLIVAAAILALAGVVRLFGAPIVFRVITPTPSITSTPSITLTPTITFTPSRTLPPTITFTATKTFTATPSPTPFVPFNIQQQFTSNVPANPKLVVHPLSFALSVTKDLEPVLPTDVFFNPVQKIMAVYTYENVNVGVEWTVVVLLDGVLWKWDSFPWADPVAGKGVISWNTSPNFFPNGTYEVQIFAGGEWKQTGIFYVVRAAPGATDTVSPTITRLPSQTSTSPVANSPTPSVTPTK